MNKKGQASFESLLIATIILILSITAVSKYFGLSDQTTAIAILKEKAMEKISAATEFHIVKGITVPNETANAIELNVDFEPDFASNPLDTLEIQTEIISKTKYKSGVTVTVS